MSAGKEVAQGGRTLAMLSARLWLATEPLLSLPRIGWVNDESESVLGFLILNILNSNSLAMGQNWRTKKIGGFYAEISPKTVPWARFLGPRLQVCGTTLDLGRQAPAVG